MTKNAEQLAWDLLKVISSYSPEDIEEALALISSGRLFVRPNDLVRKVSISDSAADRRRSSEKRIDEKIASAENARRMDVDKIFISLSSGEQEIIRDLASGISSGKYLKSSGSIREFASQINANLPKKLPQRSALALRIVEEILLLDESSRGHFVNLAKTLKEDVSSLQSWSDLIIKEK